MQRHVNDPYVKASKQLNYRSRAAFKFLELDSRFTLLKSKATVLEIGSAPGSWTQAISEKLGASGNVVAVDLNDMEAVPGVAFVQGDIGSEEVQKKIDLALDGRRADFVLSMWTESVDLL